MFMSAPFPADPWSHLGLSGFHGWMLVPPNDYIELSGFLGIILFGPINFSKEPWKAITRRILRSQPQAFLTVCISDLNTGLPLDPFPDHLEKGRENWSSFILMMSSHACSARCTRCTQHTTECVKYVHTRLNLIEL